jgi:ABC-type spermidine/putrescine transport system permease subunit II
MRAPRFLYVPLVVAFILMYLPLAAVVVFSFNASSAPTMPIHHLTTSWYSGLANDSDMREALVNTIKLGLSAVVISVLLASTGALGIRGRRFPGRGTYEFVIGMPFLLPEVVTGLALLTFFTQMHISLSLTTILLGHVLFCVGAAFRVIAARLEAMPRSLEDAAHDLGRGTLGTFWYVTLPGMRSALVTAALLVFALSFDQTIITVLVSGTQNTLPSLLWAKMRIGFTPELNALATLILLVTVVLSVPLAYRTRGELGQ